MPTEKTPPPEEIERWTAQRKAAIILEVLKGQISVPEAARKAERVSSVGRGVSSRWRRGAQDESERSGGEVSRGDQTVAGQDRAARDGRRDPSGGDATFSFGRSDVERVVAKGKGPRQRVCRLLNVARSTSYYRPHDRVATVDDVLAQRIKHLIDAEPYLGYRMVWARLRMAGFIVNRKVVQRLMQIKGWQCHRRLKKRCSPRVEVSASVCRLSNVRWATDATYIWMRWDGLVCARLRRSLVHWL